MASYLERVVHGRSAVRAMNGDPLPAAEHLIAELNHRIDSPLAAIRNALYLAACRTADPELHYFLQLADAEISSIADILRAARQASVKKAPALGAAMRRAAA